MGLMGNKYELPRATASIVLGNVVRQSGETGGQTINGGTSSGDNLTLKSTSNATKGVIAFPEAGGFLIGTGTDEDTTIFTVNVTGSPKVSWDESEDKMLSSKGWIFNETITIVPISPPTVISSTTGLDTPIGLDVVNGFAYLVNSGTANTLAIYDVIDPTTPVARGTISTGLNTPYMVEVSGKYAYVTSTGNNTFAIFDVSDPDNIVAKDTITTGLSSPRWVRVAGQYAYVTSSGTAKLSIFDISDPDNIVAKDSISTGLNTPFGLDVTQNYAYVTDFVNEILAIFDVSDPDNIVAKDTITTGTGSTPVGVMVTDGYAYVANGGTDKLSIFDISDVTSITAKGTVTTDLDNPWDVVVAGNFAYVSSRNNSRVQIIEVSDVTTPVKKTSVNMGTGDPRKVRVVGNNIYVNDNTGDRFIIAEIPGTTLAVADIGSLEVGTLNIQDRASCKGNLDVFGSLVIAQTSRFDGVTTFADTVSFNNNVIIGNAALATTATDGFLYISSSAGVPTGVPTTYTGMLPIHYDSTNNNLYIYNGAWKKVALV